jgi:ribosome biogenesis GTPase
MKLVEGTVIARHGTLIRVHADDHTMLVTSRRRLRWDGGPPAAPTLVVGDRVSVEVRGDEGVIVEARSRSSSLLRKSPGTPKPQVIAANIDQALLVFAARQPAPKRGLLDRFLVACHVSGITPIITFNKVDQGTGAIEPWRQIYEELGYRVLFVSARTGWGLGQVKRRLPETTTLFCGPSGAGKSSILNAVYPGFRLRVGSLSEATGKGRHTTTQAELMPLPFSGFVVDTPGLKEFGLWDIEPADLGQCFPEIRALTGSCRFADCSHLQEPGCAVRDALAAGELDEQRYRSYETLSRETR